LKCPTRYERVRKVITMSTYHDDIDLTTLIGHIVDHEYTRQERERELLEAAAEDFEGYTEWSEDVENFEVINGQLQHKPEPKRGPFIGGIEV